MSVELPIDHVAFGARDLDRAMETVTAAGLSMTPIGRAEWSIKQGAQTARTVSIVLGDQYLDIIEYDDAVDDLAPTGVVLRTTDIDATRSELMRAGIRCGRPYVIVRSFFGGGPDQRYRIFGTATTHSCGLPQSVIETEPGPAMQNTGDHVDGSVLLEDGARLLGVDLSA